jgi:membrane protease YdiL (CAAX protease family)
MENKSAPVLGYFPHARISPRTAVWSVLAGIGFSLPAFYLVTLIPLPEPSRDMVAAAAKRAAVFGLAPGMLLLKSLVLAPLLEEGFYRGLVLPLLKKYLPLWIAVSFPTIFFAAAHISAGPANVAFALVAGLLLTWLVLRSRSLWPAMLCHAAINLAIIWVFKPFLLARGLVTPAGLLDPMALALCGGSLVLFVAGLRILDREAAPRQAGSPGETRIQGGRAVAAQIKDAALT